MSRRHLLMLLTLSAIWGASFLFIKVGVRELEPATLIFVRVGLAALTLVPVVLLSMPAREAGSRLLGEAVPLATMGLLNSAVPFWLISWAEVRIDSGVTAILQACAPLFTALLAWRLMRTERVTGVRLAGVVIGFVGVAVLVAAFRPAVGSSSSPHSRWSPRACATPPPRSTAAPAWRMCSRCSSPPAPCSPRR